MVLTRGADRQSPNGVQVCHVVLPVGLQVGQEGHSVSHSVKVLNGEGHISPGREGPEEDD